MIHFIFSPISFFLPLVGNKLGLLYQGHWYCLNIAALPQSNTPQTFVHPPKHGGKESSETEIFNHTIPFW